MTESSYSERLVQEYSDFFKALQYSTREHRASRTIHYGIK